MNSYYSKEKYAIVIHQNYIKQFAQAANKRRNAKIAKNHEKQSISTPKNPPFCLQKQPLFRFNSVNPSKKPNSRKLKQSKSVSRGTSISPGSKNYHQFQQQHKKEVEIKANPLQKFEHRKYDSESDDEEKEHFDKSNRLFLPYKVGSHNNPHHSLHFYEYVDGKKCKVVSAKDVEIPLTINSLLSEDEVDFESNLQPGAKHISATTQLSNLEFKNSSNILSSSSNYNVTLFQSFQSSLERFSRPVLEDGYNYEYEQNVVINKDYSIDMDKILANAYEQEKLKIDTKSLMPLFLKPDSKKLLVEAKRQDDKTFNNKASYTKKMGIEKNNRKTSSLPKY